MMQHPNTHGGLLNLQNDEDHGQINPGMRSPGALMLLAPTSDANIPLISRLDAVRYPRSQIYRDSLSNVLRDYKNYQFRLPPGCGSTMTVNGYDSDGGHLIELTFQNSHRGAIGYKFNLPINIVERTSKQETDVDVILGQDYVIQVTSEYERIGVIGHPSLLLPNHLHGDVFSMTQQGLYDNQSGTSAPQNSAISSLDYRFPSGFFMQEPDNASYSNITNPASYSNEPFPAGSGQQEQSPRGKEHLDSTTDIDMSSSQPGDFSFPGLFNANL
ncbi:hypothetical protein F5Y18DRAFT_274967 [Xylariaceae sp. FL1019]|nr:hypothetical protein F5Y18DRAFT_274967 [Xylariaceae sp. FL1019]